MHERTRTVYMCTGWTRTWTVEVENWCEGMPRQPDTSCLGWQIAQKWPFYQNHLNPRPHSNHYHKICTTAILVPECTNEKQTRSGNFATAWALQGRVILLLRPAHLRSASREENLAKLWKVHQNDIKRGNFKKIVSCLQCEESRS